MMFVRLARQNGRELDRVQAVRRRAPSARYEDADLAMSQTAKTDKGDH